MNNPGWSRSEGTLGDWANTAWDVLLYFLVFGGVPTLIVGIPLP